VKQHFVPGLGAAVALFIFVGTIIADEPAEAPFEAPPFQVPDGFEVELVAGPPLVKFPMLGGFDPAGRLFLCEAAGVNMKAQELLDALPNYIGILEDTDGDGRFDQRSTFADKMTFPQGVLLHRGAMYTASPPHIWRLEDTDGDGDADRRDKLVSKFNFLGHAGSIHGPFLGPSGRIFWCNAPLGHEIHDADGNLVSQGTAARVFSCRADGTDIQSYCGGGMYNPVEIAFTPEGDMLGVMTWYNPDEARHDALVHYVYGGVYPRRIDVWLAEFKRTGPVLPPLIRYGVVAPSGIVRYRGTQLGGDFQNNYFVSYFNTSSVDRIRLVPDGSTYRAVAEPFLTSTSPDFHPCDVIEDADGSLLVIDTGGWFAGNGCPTSKTSKPEFLGAIYRIRRTGASSHDDPRGGRIEWSETTDAALADLLDDPRPAVRDRARELLVARGDAAIASLRGVLHSSAGSPFRSRALWTLARIGNGPALRSIHVALSDADPDVRLAAANSVANYPETAALDGLLPLLSDGDPRVRRAAATALGRIGDSRAVGPLLEALAVGTDRFLEHALIFALIEIDDRQATLVGFEHPAPQVRRAALIAVDQSDHGRLSQDDVAPLLDTADDELQRTALDIISRRGWTEESVELLTDWLATPDLTDLRQRGLRGALHAMESDEQIQHLIADTLNDDETSPAVQLLLLDVVARSQLAEPPAVWRPSIEALLRADDSAVVQSAVRAAERNRPRQFAQRLLSIARDARRPGDLRLAAAAAGARILEPLEDDIYGLLSRSCQRDQPPVNRLRAAEALALAKLTGVQLLDLAQRLGDAGPLELRTLVRAFDRDISVDIGRQVVTSLSTAPGLESLPAASLRALVDRLPADIQEEAAALLERASQTPAEEVERLEQIARSMSEGDTEQGRELFFGKKAACYACHRIGGEGDVLGPDLSQIGQVRTRRDLLEAILLPSATLARGYESYSAVTGDGRIVSGVISHQTAGEIHLRTSDRAEHRIARGEIDELVPSNVSVMPQGLANLLSPEELSDLIAYLESLKP